MTNSAQRSEIELRRLVQENHDHCINCGRQFKEGDTTHWGYLGNGSPSYLCDICSEALAETVSKTYYIPYPYRVPDDSANLWRYMDFTKYVSLLSTRSLYFARADHFEDIFEGAKGLRRNKTKWDNHYKQFFRDAIRNPPEGVKFDLSNEEVELQALKLVADIEKGGEHLRKTTYISCWHESSHESEAMWRLYSSFLPNAIAIRTTYKGLYCALGRSTDIRIGRVEYIDFGNGYAGVNDAFWRKRRSFEHEREVRAIFHEFNKNEPGKLMTCDLSLLIEEVFVSPKAPNWLIHLVNDVNRKYGVAVQISSSSLNEEPFF